MGQRSGNDYTCGHCGYHGPCYGTPTSAPCGVSAPWCPVCGKNDKLVPDSNNKEDNGGN